MSGKETAVALAAGLRSLADMIQANPEIADEFAWALNNIAIPIGRRPDEKAVLAAVVRAASRAGATITKGAYGTKDQLFGAKVKLGAVSFDVWGDRDQVCERVVTGTREVTKEVLDPGALAAVPKVTVTEVVEEVEWRCTSLLAVGGES